MPLQAPTSLPDFQSYFSDEAACLGYLLALRWPEGFVCPGCGGAAHYSYPTMKVVRTHYRLCAVAATG